MVSRRRIWMRRGSALAALVAVVVGAGVGVGVIAASSDSPPGKRTSGAIYERGLGGDGWPWLAGVINEPGAKGRAWQRCSPDCGDVLSAAEFFEPGRTAPGAFFRLSAPDGDVVWEDRTPAWQGQVRSTKAPTLDGDPSVGSTVTPHRGSWAGGWPDDGSTVGVRACRTAKGDRCVAISASLVLGAGPRSSVEVGPAYVGWYLGAIEQRVGRRRSVPAVKTVPPGGTVVSRFPSPTPGQTVAAGKLVGPVLAAG